MPDDDIELPAIPQSLPGCRPPARRFRRAFRRGGAQTTKTIPAGLVGSRIARNRRCGGVVSSERHFERGGESQLETRGSCDGSLGQPAGGSPDPCGQIGRSTRRSFALMFPRWTWTRTHRVPCGTRCGATHLRRVQRSASGPANPRGGRRRAAEAGNWLLILDSARPSARKRRSSSVCTSSTAVTKMGMSCRLSSTENHSPPFPLRTREPSSPCPCARRQHRVAPGNSGRRRRHHGLVSDQPG